VIINRLTAPLLICGFFGVGGLWGGGGLGWDEGVRIGGVGGCRVGVGVVGEGGVMGGGGGGEEGGERGVGE